MAGRDEKREEEHWGCDGNVNYIDCGGDFTDVYLCQYYCIIIVILYYYCIL